MSVIAFDTSNYTTSAAWYDGIYGRNSGKLLPVKPGELGLRQSDALFQHVKRLPEIVDGLKSDCDFSQITAVGASTRPRAVEGSYMPCFLAGESQGRVLSDLLSVPFHAFSHQQGHIAAVLWSAGRMDLMDGEFLAWHLSGGTTELLHVTPGLTCEILGGTSDISAGQLIDRTGQLLELQFPSGKAIDALAQDAHAKPFKVKVGDLHFSLSGMENKVHAFYDAGTPHAEIAAFSLETCCYAVLQTTKQALTKLNQNLPVVFTGGVSSNSMLRRKAAEIGGIFGEPGYSTDNAMGVAVLTYLAENAS